MTSCLIWLPLLGSNQGPSDGTKKLKISSIHKIQRAMVHSSLNVLLTYLRGLEIAELEESDMPMIL